MATENFIAHTFSEEGAENQIVIAKPIGGKSGTHEPPITEPKNRIRRSFNILLLAGISLVTLFFVASVIWRYSGSNQWEFVGETNGVRVYSWKSPGSDLKKFKTIFRIHSTLAGLVKYMQDPDACNDIGCDGAYTIERVDDQLQYSYFQFRVPFPFYTREFVVRQQFHQNPQTKEVLVEYAASPDRLPPNGCCFRVTDMDNTWRLTPLENGQVQIEYIMNMNEAGFMPDLLKNVVRPKILYQLYNLEHFVNKEKYQNAKFEFIREKS